MPDCATDSRPSPGPPDSTAHALPPKGCSIAAEGGVWYGTSCASMHTILDYFLGKANPGSSCSQPSPNEVECSVTDVGGGTSVISAAKH